MGPEERVLAILTRTGDPWEVAGLCRIPFSRLAELLHSLSDRGLIRVEPGRLVLTPAGRRRARSLADLAGPRLASLAARYRRLLAGRPPVADAHDQGHLTVGSVLARVREMARFGDLFSGVRVVVLGDDDLASLALALTGLPARVTVFEIDGRVTRFIAARARERGLAVETHAADLRHPLPAAHRGAYDVFLCDPPETEAGLRLFLGRGLSALRPGPGAAGYFGLTLIEADYGKWRRLQRWLLRHPVVVSAVLPDHGLYHNWPTLAEEARAYGLAAFAGEPPGPWYRSALYRVETVEGFRPPGAVRARGDPIVDEHYFAAKRKRRR